MNSLEDRIVEAGIRAYRRKQQRFTDRSDREMLHALVDDNAGKLVLDKRYNICIVREPETVEEPAKPLTRSQLLKVRTIQ
jgi:hypothetical protein